MCITAFLSSVSPSSESWSLRVVLRMPNTWNHQQSYTDDSWVHIFFCTSLLSTSSTETLQPGCLKSATNSNCPHWISLYSAPNSVLLMFCQKPSQSCLKSDSYLTLLLLPCLPCLICESCSLTPLDTSLLSTPAASLDSGPHHLTWATQSVLSGQVSLHPGHTLPVIPTTDKMNLFKKKN